MREELITAGCRVAGAVTGRLASRQDTVPPPNPSIVVLRRCCLGDVLGSTAMLDALRKRYPLARIDYATSRYSAPALMGNPDVSAIVEPTVEALRKGSYDVAIVLERSPAAGVLPWLARIPIRVGLNNLSRGFAHNLRVACPPDRSEAELALDCATALGVPAQSARAKFCPSLEDQRRAAGLLPAGQIIALAPAGGVNPRMSLTTKRWPAQRYAQLAERLAAAARVPVVLIGAQDDAPVAREVAAHASQSVVNLCGQTTFGQTAAIIERARLLVGNDSAPLHLAAAVGTPFVGIFGPSDPVRHRPFGHGEVVAAPIPRNAYRNGFAAIDCIGMLSVEQVLAACRRMLAA